MEVRTYRLTQEAKRKKTKSFIIRVSILLGVAIIVGCSIPYFQSKASFDLPAMAVATGVMLVATTFIAIYTIRRKLAVLRADLQSYEVELTPVTITVTGANGVRATLLFADIASMKRLSDDGWLVRGRSSEQLYVAGDVDGFAEIDDVLRANCQNISDKAAFRLAPVWIVTAAVVTSASMFVVFTSTHKVAVGIAGIILLLTLVIGAITTYRHRRSLNVRPITFVFLTQIILLILYAVYTKLFGQ